MGKRGSDGDKRDGYREKDKQGTFVDPAKLKGKGGHRKDDKNGKGK
jgi:hypothetical protein